MDGSFISHFITRLAVHGVNMQYLEATAAQLEVPVSY